MLGITRVAGIRSDFEFHFYHSRQILFVLMFRVVGNIDPRNFQLLRVTSKASTSWISGSQPIQVAISKGIAVTIFHSLIRAQLRFNLSKSGRFSRYLKNT